MQKMLYRWVLRSGFVAGVLVLVAATIRAQEAAPPSVDLYEGQELPEASPTPALPPNGPELSDLKQLDETFKPPSLGTDADATKMRVEWRELRNRTVNDPTVKAAKAYAQSAPTDLEKRQRLREYYNVYYQRMSVLTNDAGIKLALEAFRNTHQALLAQPRVRPTPIPEGATPTPVPAKAAKKPDHKQKKKKKNKFHM
ncbi:MAG TPA: hypothetical protein VH227_00395 [Candidatus Udaeobacter sp.]|jgi:hypothetical protein|nr:hypothetical protein [Candidatus Udaeobacter sp.]